MHTCAYFRPLGKEKVTKLGVRRGKVNFPNIIFELGRGIRQKNSVHARKNSCMFTNEILGRGNLNKFTV